MSDYRKVLRDNLSALMKARGYSVKRPPPAYYLEGTKKGRKVSARTIQYMMSPENPYSPRLDALAAVAVALGLQPGDLLDPGLLIRGGPASFEAAVEAEVSRRMVTRMQELQGGLTALLRMQQGGSGTSGISTDESTDREVPGGGKTNKPKRAA